MRFSWLFLPVLAACLAGLAGCAAPAPSLPSDSNIDQEILAASKQIQAAQAGLYQSGVLAQQGPPGYAGPNVDQLVTLTWHGDALQLLAKLAHDHRLDFVFTGVRLPLPVSIVAQDTPIDSVIEQIRAQIGYRALIEEQGSSLRLVYNPPRRG